MTFYEITTIIISLAVLIAYLNHRFVKLPTTIGIMAGALMLSLGLIFIGKHGFEDLEHNIANTLAQINFNELLMEGMLSFLLFAGALTVDINDLKRVKWEVGILATFSTICSTLIVGVASYYLLNGIGIEVQLIHTLLFGALISPTDPIAVLAIFKKLGAPKELDVSVSGESLFNDGVGIVLFLSLYELAFTPGAQITLQGVSTLFFQQAIGGIVYGIALGLLGYWLIKPLNDGKIEILVTLAIATGGYGFAEVLHISGPLAMVVSGIFIGNQGRQFHMAKHVRHNLDTFWELVDEVLNAVLFLLIGLEILVIPISHRELVAAVLIIPIVLLTRWVTVGVPMSLFKLKRKYYPHTVNIMTWGGLRGGLAVALALALPPGHPRGVILTMTYAVVVFAIIVQGLTITSLLKRSQYLHQNGH